MTAIIVLRHPQTTWNREERYQGRLDAPLSDEGRRQLERTAAVFRGQSLDCVITSPLSRARCLAEAVAVAARAPLRTDFRLTEIGQGAWEGLHVSEIRARHAALYARWESKPDTVRFPGGGENLAEVERRMASAFDDIFAAFPGGTVAVVSHSVVVQLLVCRSLHVDREHLHKISISNASVTTICGGQSPGILLSLNVTDALYGSPVESARAGNCAGR